MFMIKKQVLVDKDKKIDRLLQDFGFSYADVQKMLRNKDVRVNGVAQKQNVSVFAGDEVTFYYSQDMLQKKYKKIFESDNVLVIYKYNGIETEGENGLEGVLKAKAVHRLDRNTEGLMVFAKNDKSAKILENAFKNHLVHKFYVAEVVGKLDTNQTYKAYLLKDKENAQVKIFKNPTKGAVEIQTKVKTLKSSPVSSLLEIELLTGKTHQIRAHLAYLGYPIIGDGKYGKNEINKKFKEKTQKLGCFKLIFEKIGIFELDGKCFEEKPKWFVLK